MKDLKQHYDRLFAAFNQGAWPHVKQFALQILPAAPHDPALHYLLGIAHIELQQPSEGLVHLRKATQLDPKRPDFATQYAKTLAMLQMMDDAVRAADRAMNLAQDYPPMLDTLGVVYSQANAHESAVKAFKAAVAKSPKHASYRFNLAFALTAIGNDSAAEKELEASIEIDPQQWRAHLSLAQLRKQTPGRNHISRMSALLLRHAQSPAASIYINMALGKEYEDLADYSNAFTHLSQAKANVRRGRPYSSQRDRDAFEHLAQSFPIQTREITHGHVTNEPIFIIGMPRTGTTLLDRIISSHPDVYSAGELQNFAVTLQRLSKSKSAIVFDPNIVDIAHTIDWKTLGSEYLASTRPATAGKLRFIDKMPHNFLYAGFIARALPYAKIICLRRDPLDTCLSNFRHLFEQDSSYYDYSNNLLDTGRYYALFDRLMAHWHSVFPSRILEVKYETLVHSFEASTRQLLAFCELPWNDSCLRFEENAAPVSTPNAWQVRAPIYSSSINRWKNFEPRMDDLKKVLRDEGISLSD